MLPVVAYRGEGFKEFKGALGKLKTTMQFEGEMFEFGLLWKNATLYLPNTYSSAVSQLKYNERRLE